MDTVAIREEIKKALQHEKETRELALLLLQRVEHLHANIIGGESSATEQTLLAFIHKFINRTPVLMDTLLGATRNSRREELCEALSDSCGQFFTSPPALMAGREGLNGAMAKAYFCQRLIEEINDYCAVTTGNPLLPLDITCSNLIIHQLIGEPFANFLDELVEIQFSQLQELTPTCSTPHRREHLEFNDRIQQACREHGLLDRGLAPDFYIASQYFSCTIH